MTLFLLSCLTVMAAVTALLIVEARWMTRSLDRMERTLGRRMG